MAALRSAWSLPRRFVVLEIGIWRSLALWVARRVSGRGPGVATFTYAKQVSPLITAFIFVSLVELPVVHLLLPWESVRLVADVLSVWGLLWMLGLRAGVHVFPHLMDGEGVRVRYGASADIRVPWEAIARVRGRRGSVVTGKTVVIERDGDGDLLAVNVAVMKLTRVEIELHGPTALVLPGGVQEGVTHVRLYADDPAAFVARARAHLGQRVKDWVA